MQKKCLINWGLPVKIINFKASSMGQLLSLFSTVSDSIWRNERLRVQDFLFFSFTKFLDFLLTYIKVQHLILITITSTFRICFQFYKFQTENGRNVWTNIKNTSKTSKNESVKINSITLNANISVKIKLFSYFQSFLA